MFTKTQAFPGESFYTQVPTHWLRDPFLGSPAKAVLSYWQSHAIGYRVTIEQTIAEMAEGRDYVYAAVKDALARGYLVRLQGRGGRGRFGSVEYTYGPAAYEQQYVRNWGARSDGTEGPVGDHAAAVAPVDNSASSHVSAGGTAYALTGSGGTGSGPTGDGGTGNGSTASGQSDTKKINPLKDQSLSSCNSEKDQKPVSSDSARESLPRESEHESEGDDFSDSEKQLLNAAVEKAITVRAGRTGWSQQAIVAAMQTQLAAGYTPARVAGALVDVAADPEAKFPGRIEFVLNAPPAGVAQSAETPAWVVGPVKYLRPGTAMCARHGGEPAHNCNRCAAEAKGAQVDAESVTTGPVLSAAEARKLARANATTGGTVTPLRRRTGPFVPEAAKQAAPSSLAGLRAAVEQLVEASQAEHDERVEASA